jgi:hypothetical protein
LNEKWWYVLFYCSPNTIQPRPKRTGGFEPKTSGAVVAF